MDFFRSSVVFFVSFFVFRLVHNFRHRLHRIWCIMFIVVAPYSFFFVCVLFILFFSGSACRSSAIVEYVCIIDGPAYWKRFRKIHGPISIESGSCYIKYFCHIIILLAFSLTVCHTHKLHRQCERIIWNSEQIPKPKTMWRWSDDDDDNEYDSGRNGEKKKVNKTPKFIKLIMWQNMREIY